MTIPTAIRPFLLLMLLAAAPAHAQIRDLDPALPTRPNLSAQDRSAIETFVAAQAPMLSGEYSQIRAARQRLLAPLQAAGASVQFRLAYSAILDPVLRRLVGDQRDEVAINAIRIAGELATPAGLGLLASTLADQRPSVRVSTAQAYQQTFSHLGRSTPAITPERARDAVLELARAAERENNPFALDGIVQALTEASVISQNAVQGVRPEAISAISKTVGARAIACDTGDAFAPALLRAGQSVRDALIYGGLNEPGLDPAVVRDAAGLAGDLVQAARCRLCRDEPGATDCTPISRPNLIAIVAVAEAVYTFAQQNIGRGGQPLDLKLFQMIDGGRDAQFCQSALQLVGANGALTASPFDFPDGRFMGCGPRNADGQARRPGE